jgi:hypothetical protein
MILQPQSQTSAQTPTNAGEQKMIAMMELMLKCKDDK